LRTTLSGNQQPAALLIPIPADFKNDVRRCAGQLPGEKPVAQNAADLFHRALGAPVLLAHSEDDGIDERKGVIEHQALDFAIGRSAPMAAGNEGPADLDFAKLSIITIIAA
jgi:hypothetical protein